MANPQPAYFINASSLTLRITMAALKNLALRTSQFIRKVRLIMGTTTGIILTYGIYKTLLGGQSYVTRAQTEGPPVPSYSNLPKPPFDTSGEVSGGFKPRPKDFSHSPPAQPCVSSYDKAHALFVWIRVKQEADLRQVADCVARLQQYIEQVEAPSLCQCGNHQILAGVGFGPEFYKQLKGGAPEPFNNAKHSLINSGMVGGDILIHAKCNKQELLKQLSKVLREKFPEGSILSYEETYGQHKDPLAASRQQSGSEPLGILNYQYTKGGLELFPPNNLFYRDKPNLLFVREAGSKDTELKRKEMAVDPKTGGSYAMTQKWVHDAQMLNSNGVIKMNDWVDKAWEDCAGPPGERKFSSLGVLGAELANLSMDKWMDEAYKDCLAIQKKHPKTQIACTPGSSRRYIPFQILRQFLPFKTPGGESGLFFVSYANTPRYNELLLDRLVASISGGGRLNRVCQNVFLLSRNVRSACWYFPGADELRELRLTEVSD